MVGHEFKQSHDKLRNFVKIKGNEKLLLPVSKLEDEQDWGAFTGVPAAAKNILPKIGITHIGQILGYTKHELHEKFSALQQVSEGEASMYMSYIEHAINRMFGIPLDKYVNLPDFGEAEDFISLKDLSKADRKKGFNNLIEEQIKKDFCFGEEFVLPKAMLQDVFVKSRKKGEAKFILEVSLTGGNLKLFDRLKEEDVKSKFSNVITKGFEDLLIEQDIACMPALDDEKPDVAGNM